MAETAAENRGEGTGLGSEVEEIEAKTGLGCRVRR